MTFPASNRASFLPDVDDRVPTGRPREVTVEAVNRVSPDFQDVVIFVGVVSLAVVTAISRPPAGDLVVPVADTVMWISNLSLRSTTRECHSAAKYWRSQP